MPRNVFIVQSFVKSDKLHLHACGVSHLKWEKSKKNLFFLMSFNTTFISEEMLDELSELVRAEGATTVQNSLLADDDVSTVFDTKKKNSEQNLQLIGGLTGE